MLRARTSPADRRVLLVLGVRAVFYAVQKRHGAVGHWDVLRHGSTVIQLVDGERPSLADLLAALNALLLRIERSHFYKWKMSVLIADPWLASAIIPWCDGLGKVEQAEAIAIEQLSGLGFDVSNQDSVRLADAPYGQPRWAVAYPAELANALMRLNKQGLGCVSSVMPISAAAWEAEPKARTRKGIVIADDGWVTWLRSENSPHPSWLASSSVPAHGMAAIGVIWRRMLLREPSFSSTDEWRVLELGVEGKESPTYPPGFMTQAPKTESVASSTYLWMCEKTFQANNPLNFIRRPVRPGALHWLVVGAASLGLTIATYQATPTFQRWMQRTEVAKTTLAESRPLPPSALSRDDLARVKAVNQAIEELNRPFSALLRGLEPPPDLPITILAVDSAARTPGSQPLVRVTAEARSGLDMARYVAHVGMQRPYVDAYLVKHQINDADPAGLLRFSMEARWAD